MDALDTRALRKIRRIPYSGHISNVEVKAVSGSLLLSNTVLQHHLRFCCHNVRSTPNEDDHRAAAAVIHKPLSNWKQPPEEPNTHRSQPLSLIYEYQSIICVEEVVLRLND